MTSARTLIDLTVSPSTGLNRGKALAVRRSATTGMGGFEPWATENVVALLDTLAARPVDVPAGGYAHPLDMSTPSGRVLARQRLGQQGGGLSAADVAWIQRLPVEPDEVSFDDAVELAKLAASVDTDSPDRRLVDSVWLPVKRVHDRRRAEADLAAAQRPVPALPAEAAPAVTDLIRLEVPALSPLESAQRARDQLEEARQARIADAALAQQAARDELARISSDAADAVSTTRPAA